MGPEQALTAEEALLATCVVPAWLEHQEERRGRLGPGMLADLAVLDRDPLSCPPEELCDMTVLATMVGGRWTFAREGGPVQSGCRRDPECRFTRSRAGRRSHEAGIMATG